MIRILDYVSSCGDDNVGVVPSWGILRAGLSIGDNDTGVVGLSAVWGRSVWTLRVDDVDADADNDF